MIFFPLKAGFSGRIYLHFNSHALWMINELCCKKDMTLCLRFLFSFIRISHLAKFIAQCLSLYKEYVDQWNPTPLKNPSSGHDSKQAKINSLRGIRPGSHFGFYQAYLLWFILNRKSNRKPILWCFHHLIQWLQDQRQWRDICPEAASRTLEENTLPFIASPRSVCTLSCIIWRIGSLSRQPPVWSRIAMAITLMGDKCWIDIAKGSLESEEKNNVHSFTVPRRKVNLLSLVIFWSWGTWWLNPSFYVRDEYIS